MIWAYGLCWVLCLIGRTGVAFGLEKGVDDKQVRDAIGCLVSPLTFTLALVQVVSGVGFAYLLLTQWGCL